MVLEKIISGGQTGADQGGIIAGLMTGIETGGSAPRDYRTELGTCLWLEQLNLKDTQDDRYKYRTYLNVIHSDGTIIFRNPAVDGPGSRLTIKECMRHKKPYLEVLWKKDGPAMMTDDEIEDSILEFIVDYDIKICNIAGNRESKSPGIFAFTRDRLFNVITKFRIASLPLTGPELAVIYDG